MENNYFLELNSINVNDKVEKKNGLTYLSWAWAWGEIKKVHPNAIYTVYENSEGWNYFTDGRTCWVKTGMTINGIEHIEYLPVMDYRNKSIPFENVTSFDVNKAIQRSLTKAAARHGLGLYIYAGEDLPECEENNNQEGKKKTAKTELKPLKEKIIETNRVTLINLIKSGEKLEEIKNLIKLNYPDKKSSELSEIECADILKKLGF